MRMKFFNWICLLSLLFPWAAIANEAGKTHVHAPMKRLLVFGDSLVAGYDMPMTDAFPAQLEEKLKADGHNIIVINAGVSGDTTSGGLTRLAFTLDQHHPDFAILELGANDMFRVIDPAETKKNLAEMLTILESRKIKTLLAGMKATPNLGAEFTAAFEKIYPELAAKHDVVYYPFFMEGVAAEKEYLLSDGLHPNKSGVARMVEKIYPKVSELITAEPLLPPFPQ